MQLVKKMSGRLQDKIAIVTGASSGIGRAIAFAYHSEGAHVVCADICETSRLQNDGGEAAGTTHDLINEQGGKAIFVKVDVTSDEQVRGLVKAAVDWGGRLDVICNNAGVALHEGNPKPVWEESVDIWNRTNAINSTGVFLGIKYAATQMLNQEPHPSGDRGWIINTTSVLGIVGGRECASYCASKGAVVNLTRAAASDCGPHRIHVNAIAPGYTASAMTQSILDNPERRKVLASRHSFGERLGEPEDLARACVFLASADARW